MICLLFFCLPYIVYVVMSHGLQGQELSEAGVKIGLLEKKVESADVECEKKVAIEKEELQRVRDIMDEQERLALRSITSD